MRAICKFGNLETKNETIKISKGEAEKQAR